MTVNTKYPYPSISYPSIQNPGANGTFSGARAIFLINSAPVAFAGGVSYEENIDYEPVDVLSLLEVAEFVPVAYRCSLSAQLFRVVGASLKATKVMPRLEDILTYPDLEATLQDVVTGNTVALMMGVKCAGGSTDVTARGLVQTNASFMCIRIKDESEL